MEVGTSTAVLKFDKASLHVPITKDAVTNTEFDCDDSKMEEVGQRKQAHQRVFFDSMEIGTPSCWGGSLFARAVSTPCSFRASPRRGQRWRGIVGSGPVSPKFAADSTVEEFFVFNVDSATSISDVFVFLNGKATVVRLTQISHPDARSKSFILAVPSYERVSVLCPNFWPIGVRCRPFIRPTVGRLASLG